MKKLPVLLALLFLTVAIWAQPAPGAPKGRIDTRGLDRYIAIAEDIRNGKKVRANEWDKLFETPFFYLAINSFKYTTADAFKKEMETAFQTTKPLSEQETMSLSRHLAYKQLFSQLKAYSRKVNNGGYRKALQKHLYPSIPNRLKYDSLIPPVVITWYPSTEANGLEDMILQDALLSYQCDSIAEGVLTAHEAIHSLFTKSLKQRSKIPLVETDIRLGAVQLLSAIAQEGIADLIDKETLAKPGTLMFTIQEAFTKEESLSFTRTVKGLDSVLQQVAAGNNPTDLRAAKATVMAYAGHIPGREMAKTIRKAGLLPEVIADGDNPFVFFYTYNKAVTKLANGHPVLSETSIAVLKGLEEQLIKPL